MPIYKKKHHETMKRKMTHYGLLLALVSLLLFTQMIIQLRINALEPQSLQTSDMTTQDYRPQERAINSIQSLHKIQLILFLFSFVTLTIFIFKVFLPLFRQQNRAIRSLKNVENELIHSILLEKIKSDILEVSDSDLQTSEKLTLVFKKIFKTKDIHLNNRVCVYIKDFTSSPQYNLYFSDQVQNPPHSITINDEELKSYQGTRINELCEEFANSDDLIFQPLLLGKRNLGFLTVSIFENDTSPNFTRKALTQIADSISHLLEKEINKKKYNAQKQILEHSEKLVSLGELAAGVGHEINNPLTIVKSYVQNLQLIVEKKKTVDIEDLTDKLNRINIAIDRITAIVKGLRSFSRSNDDRVENFDILDAIQESLFLITSIYQKEGVKLNLKPSSDNIKTKVMGNRGKIQQVIMNLLGNARDATEGQETRLIDIDVHTDEHNIYILIADNGPGIPQDIIDKVFNPFFTTKEVNKGTGLGLSLSHTFITEHQGEINCKNKLDSGCEFTIRLPLATGELEEKIVEQVHLENIDKKECA